MAIPTAIQVEALDLENENFDADVAYENLRAHLQRYGTLLIPDEDIDALKQAIARIRDTSTGLSHDFATLLTAAAFPDEVDAREYWNAAKNMGGASLHSSKITREMLDNDWADTGALVLLDEVSFAVVGNPERRSIWLDSKRQIEEIAPLTRLNVTATCRDASRHLQSRSLTSESEVREFLGKPLELMLRGSSSVILSDRYLAKNSLDDAKRISALRVLCDALDAHATRQGTPTRFTLITTGHEKFGPAETARRLIDQLMSAPAVSLKAITEIEVIATASDGQVEHDRYLRAGRCGFFLGHGTDTLALMPERGKSAAYFSDLSTFRNLRARERKLRQRSEHTTDTVVRIAHDPRDA